jgi:hypothetical protein
LVLPVDTPAACAYTLPSVCTVFVRAPALRPVRFVSSEVMRGLG